MQKRTCSIPECDRAAHGRGWCQMHYFRWRRHGDPERTLIAPPQPKADRCQVDGCTKPPRWVGICTMHEARQRRHGDTECVIEPADRAYRKGEANPQWAGDEVGYFGVHARLRNRRGRAADCACIDCGAPAAHWSYNHAGADERESATGPYSLDTEDYDPRCIGCHHMFDADRLTPATLPPTY